MPIYIEANINGTEYEGTDAMMQVIRDLSVTPYGQNDDGRQAARPLRPRHRPDREPGRPRDGHLAATRPWLDTNRDYFVQSQPEEKIDAAIQQQYLAPGALHLHGYVTPTLIDGLTIPHNPALEYDIFGKWNQARIGAEQDRFQRHGTGDPAAGQRLRRERQFPRHRPLDAAVDRERWRHSGRHDRDDRHARRARTRSRRCRHSRRSGSVLRRLQRHLHRHSGAHHDDVHLCRLSPGLVSPSSGGYVWTAAYGPGTAPDRPWPRAGTTGDRSTARRTWRSWALTAPPSRCRARRG